MKKVICFSLWGDNDKYTVGAVKNAKLAQQMYPEWMCRFYVGQSVPESILVQLKDQDNTEVVVMDEQGDWTGMFWRFLACSDDSVDVMLSRDTDCRITPREVAAVNEWLESDKLFHIMRDHRGHCTQIMGGMWGAKKGAVPYMEDLIKGYSKGNFWQVDQNFLRDEVYPLVVGSSFVHDEFHRFEPHARPFPVQRGPETLPEDPSIYLDYVGKSLLADDSLCWG